MRTLVADIEKLKEFIGAENSTYMDTVKPSITNAERDFIKKALGAAVYELLLDGVENSNLTTDEEALLDEVLLAEAPLAFYLGAPLLNVRFGDNGLHTSQSQETERLTKWMYDEFRTQLLLDGYKALDNLYLYMEEQTSADWYSDWAASSAFTQYKSLFVNRAALMQQHVNIKGSRWLFAQMLPMLDMTEQLFIVPAIGEDFFNDLKTKFSADTASAAELVVIGKIQKCVSLMAYSRSLKDPNFINEMIVVTATKTENVKTPEVALKMYEKQVIEYENHANNFLNDLVTYLNNNATASVFADYFNSDLYEDPNDSSDDVEFDIDKRTSNDASETTFMF